MSYETDLARIEAIVAELSRDDVDLDSALRLFEEGIERLRSASAALAHAEGRVRVLLEKADGTFRLDELDL